MAPSPEIDQDSDPLQSHVDGVRPLKATRSQLWFQCRTPLGLIQFTAQEGVSAEARHQPLLESLEREREHPSLTRTEYRSWRQFNRLGTVVVIRQTASDRGRKSVCGAEFGCVTGAAQQNGSHKGEPGVGVPRVRSASSYEYEYGTVPCRITVQYSTVIEPPHLLPVTQADLPPLGLARLG